MFSLSHTGSSAWGYVVSKGGQFSTMVTERHIPKNACRDAKPEITGWRNTSCHARSHGNWKLRPFLSADRAAHNSWYPCLLWISSSITNIAPNTIYGDLYSCMYIVQILFLDHYVYQEFHDMFIVNHERHLIALQTILQWQKKQCCPCLVPCPLLWSALPQVR